LHFSHARTALKYGLQRLGLKPNDTILLPEYICDVVLQPLEQLGIRHRYYSINNGLHPIWDELENFVGDQTRAIMMVHYFGQSQDISAFQSFCNKHKLLLIEDNAHGHGGTFNGQPLGCFGDIGISSPRKTLNTISGGVLWLKNSKLESTPDIPIYPVSLNQHVKRSLLNPYLKLKHFIKKALQNRPSFEDPRAFREPLMPDYDIDRWSKNIIEQTDWDKLRKTRQAVYYNWQDFALDNGLTPVFEKLHPEANPWCFPAYAKDQQEAIKWFDWGWDNNEYVFSWPSLPEEVLTKQGKSFDRWKRLVCFGIA